MAKIQDERTAHLTTVSRDLTHPYQRPRDSATLILIDRSGSVPKVLLGRRHTRHTFMPDVFVFPGGRLDPADRSLAAEGSLDPRDLERLMRGPGRTTATKARALALTAIRETFEETGLLVGSRRADAETVADAPWHDVAGNGIIPNVSGLHFIARAITPAGRPRRYDSRFFAADFDHVRYRVDGVTGPEAELTELVWLPIPEAKDLKMPAITGVVLDELAGRIGKDMSRDLPIPLFRMLNKRFVLEML